MRVKCCYRLIPNGEVIHSEFDTDTIAVDGMPKEFLDVSKLYIPEYNISAYIGVETMFDAMCEAVLLSRDDFAFVLECCNLGYYVLEWSGFWRFLESPLDMKDKGHDSIIPHSDCFKPVGYRVTKNIQLRSCGGIYRLTASRDGKSIITNDGILIPDFDINSLDKLDFNYKGYKDAAIKGYYGVVYINGNPVNVIKDNNRLLLL